MDTLDITSVFDVFDAPDNVARYIEDHQNGFLLQIPVPALGGAGEHLSIAEDLLDASFIGENIASYAKSITLNTIPKHVDKTNPVLYFEIIPRDINQAAQLIWEYGSIFYHQANYDKEALDHYSKTMKTYDSTLNERLEFAFPELIDDYYANLIEGAYREYADSFNLEEIYSKHPERKFGYWKSAYCRSNGNIFFASTDAWLIPPGTDLQFLLKSVSGAPADIVFEPASLVIINERAYLISDDYITHFPFGSFLRSLSCKKIALTPEDYYGEYDWMETLYTYSSIQEYFTTEFDNTFPNKPKNEYCIAEYGELVLVRFEDYQYIYFGADKLTDQQVLEIKDSLTNISDKTYLLSGLDKQIKCPWEELDDEVFEQLCYDIIYYNPKFDSKTIRKMGKSRSRDGGRDIEVYTAVRPGYNPEKFIFQCKYIGAGGSLTVSKLTGISDIMDQYDAQGYGIMTSGIIDSALYDRLDGISKNRGFKMEHWSVFEIERHLSKHRAIKDRYFKSA